uniref:ABC transporter substrate-binding protein n=1 Tax=Flavobacterium sp. TaxID=239 RepID=UPI004049345A
MLKIGILLPRSTFYQTINFDLISGLKAGLNQIERNDITVVSENIGFGTDKQQCYRSAEKLILDENVSIVLAYIGHRTAELLRPLFLAANKMLVVLDAGANMPNEYPKCPNILYHSLHNALGAWLAARKATQDGFNKAGMVTGYYDGGYLQTYSIAKGFEQYKGLITFNHATGYVKNDFTMQPLINHLNTNKDSALLTLFSGDFVQWFFQEIKSHFPNKQVPIYATPFGLEETMLAQALFPGAHVQGVVAWSTEIDTTHNKLFIEKMEANGRKPNLFALLGWESATIAATLIDWMRKHTNNSSDVMSNLENFEFESPRGTISFDVQTNTFIAPMYEATVIENNGFCALKLGWPIQDVKSEFKKLAALPLNDVCSAWHNSYTCI